VLNIAPPTFAMQRPQPLQRFATKFSWLYIELRQVGNDTGVKSMSPRGRKCCLAGGERPLPAPFSITAPDKALAG
jgi:hypothetical protein